MAKTLIIVESPTKARTISRFLGNDFIVESSFGHVRDLPASQLGVDVEHDFSPKYVIPPKARPALKKLKEAVKKVTRIILATDEDREGEAIAWHLTQALDLENNKSQNTNSKQTQNSKFKIQKIERIVFHEITEGAIQDALAHPRTIDMKRVDAQQARRVLDRLVGYKLSPFLWKKVFRGLSAGRVQSVAVRLIVEREREIEKFVSQEYWTIHARVAPARDASALFDATLIKRGETVLDKFVMGTKEDAASTVHALTNAAWSVAAVEKRAVTKNPPSPFTTSTLQQDAFRRLGFSTKQTMMVAQQLYEGVDLGGGAAGLITYMRTDSLNLSEEALRAASEWIQKELGKTYALAVPRRFKTKTKGAQEAHEAIRPTDPRRTPESIKEFLDPRQFKLYDLIWRRFMATQLPQAVFDATTIDVNAVTNNQSPVIYVFRATGQVMRFDGFLKIYPIKTTDTMLPDVIPEEPLVCSDVRPEEHHTQPPPRFTEATLVKILEANGIGRPSTYAPIISTIQDRGYVERFERKYLKPTETGLLVNDLLVAHFPKIVDLQFTARIEEEFDEIAQGEKQWKPVIQAFYAPFAVHLAEKYEEVQKVAPIEMTDEVCEKCGKPMVIKLGRFGKFLACSGFPDCKTTKRLNREPDTIGMKCPKCIEGDVIVRRTARRKIFYGCSRYPKCDFASWQNPMLPTKEKEIE